MPTNSIFSYPHSIKDIIQDFSTRRDFDLYIGTLLDWGYRTKYYKLPVKQKNEFLNHNEKIIVSNYSFSFTSYDGFLTKAFKIFLISKQFNELLDD